MDEVPFEVQKWMHDALAHTMLHEITGYINHKYENDILELSRHRMVDGYTAYGSTMYNWTPEERLMNVLEELADAVVYLTSGPLPKQEEQ
jgi:hypothetical protein